ncbi:DUF1015 family protein [Vibrio sagamiensis]|uniref:DUF1015 domain-containing protein n=1 Tax=Vibrio sagamiensis NBRC 104589 TaxID=1219064 RepID=A0A511QC73_9VIBR|nr:DUF1015 family protein [Vibrio sagamiensis]GEM74895.1 hypothetical protein VSA01S_10070 [Vibrio sagamiensis NBRC 104589]
MLDLNSYFIYRIDGKWNNKHHQITGILYHYDYNSEFSPPIIPHEQTNPIRVRALESLSLNNYPPSFWITNSNNFPLDMLNQWFDQADNIIVIPTNDGMIHTISKLEKCYQSNLITKSLKKIPSFLIADGHHRYEVIRRNHAHASIPIFLISASQASFEFNEIYCHLRKQSNIDNVIGSIVKSWLIPCRLSDADFHICFNEKKWGYKYKEKNNKGINNFTLIYERLQKVSEISSIKTSPEVSSEFKFPLLIKVIHSDISDVIDQGLLGKKMPIKSTCFRYKPDEKVLDHITSVYSRNSISEGVSL